MREKLEHKVLEFHPDTLQHVREKCGLGAPGRVDEAVALLQDWIRHQDHFLKKDFPDYYLENLLVTSKGSVETAKRRLELACTMRTHAPQFFTTHDLRDLEDFMNLFTMIAMPKLTDEHYRILVIQIKGEMLESFYQDLFRFFAILLEFAARNDYNSGYILVHDIREFNAMDLVTKLNITETRNFINLVLKGYGFSIKGVHYVTPSKAIEVFVALFKQALTPKLGARIKVHKTVEELYEHVPPRLLPNDLGGECPSVKTIFDRWYDSFSSDDHVDVMREMQGAGVDEARRRTPRDDHFGLPGSFRTLSVD